MSSTYPSGNEERTQHRALLRRPTTLSGGKEESKPTASRDTDTFFSAQEVPSFLLLSRAFRNDMVEGALLCSPNLGKMNLQERRCVWVLHVVVGD